jgi:nitrogen fixation/metabolism regulation signal transduction histidine kinase
LPPSDSTELDNAEPVEGEGTDEEGNDLSSAKSKESQRIQKQNERLEKKRERKEKRKEFIDGILGREKGG